MLKKVSIYPVGIIALSLIIQVTNAQTNVTVSPETRYQTIEGWGVSLAWWANLAGGMGQSTIDELAGYAVNDLNFNVFRFNIAGGENPNCTAGDHFRKDGALMPGYREPQADGEGWGTYNLSNDARQIAVMNKIAELRQHKGDIITEMVSYSPPWWMTYGECSAGNYVATDENLKPEFIDDFADYLVSVTAALKSAYPSWNIKYLEPFNEPMSGFWKKGGPQEGSAFYPATQAQVLWRLWQRQSVYNISDIGLVAADNSKVTTALTNLQTLQQNNPGEYNGIAKINTHSYGGTWQDKAALAEFAKNNGNKPIWQSESGPLGVSFPGEYWRVHYHMAYRIIEDLRNLKTTVWCDWQLMSTADAWGMIHQTNWDEDNPLQTPVLKKTRTFYIRKNFTNFIKAGYQIIDTNNGLTLGALSPDNKEFVLVIVNDTNDTPNDYTVDLSAFPVINGFKTYRTSSHDGSSENTTEKTNATLSEKGVLSGTDLTYRAPGLSVTTFVFDIENTTLSTAEYTKNKEIQLSPNPLRNEALMTIGTPVTNGGLVIYNSLGKVVKQISGINGTSIRVTRDQLQSGMYFYKLFQKTKIIGQGSFVIN